MSKTLVIMVLALLLAACATTPPSLPLPDPGFTALGIRSVAVAPVNWATSQPLEQCSTFIDEDLRTSLVRELRRRGYDAISVGDSVPRSFSPGMPVPLPGASPPAGVQPSPGVQGVLQVWIEEYFENSLCGWEGPKYLTIGAVGALYAGNPPQEVWRSRGRAAEQGDYQAGGLIWLTTTRAAERTLATFPAGPGRVGPR